MQIELIIPFQESGPAAHLNMTKYGWVYSFGFYFPRNHHGHFCSAWSRLVLRVKKADRAAIQCVGQKLAAHFEHWPERFRPYVLTFVPSAGTLGTVEHSSCPTQLLAASIYRNLTDRQGIELLPALCQARAKKELQRKCKNLSERVANISGCYQVRDPQKVHGRNIVLLDDVVTSGATLAECALALYHAGSRDVIGVTLARTVHDVPTFTNDLNTIQKEVL